MSSSQIYCHHCGKGLPHNARFCAACGIPTVSLHQVGAAHRSNRLQLSGASFKLPVRFLKGAAWGVAALFVLVMLIVMFSGGNSPQSVKAASYTVEDYIQSERQKLQQQLNTKPNDFGKHIEDIHVTVTYKGGSVKSMMARTIDGSNNAGVNGGNISEVDVVITAYWDGYLQKNGFTEMQLLYDIPSSKLKSVKYLDSNAVFNSATVDWFKVGFTIAAWLSMK